MAREGLKALFHPVDAGLVELPQNGRVLFLGAEAGFSLPIDTSVELRAVQGLRPDFLALKAAGVAVSPSPEGDGYDAAIVRCGRHRGRNEYFIAEALERTRRESLILVGGGKEDGVASLRRYLGRSLEVEGSAPKYHGLSFWFRRPDDPGELTARLRASSAAATVEERYRTAPGMFSHERVDPGSRLLVESLPPLSGRVADFGAGWGYLAREVAERARDLAALDLYEADFDSLEAARANLASLDQRVSARFFWCDLVSEAVTERYDVIVTNPPFHRGRAAEPELGAAIIRAAGKALRPGGRVFLVANRQLPYETVLAAEFGAFDEIVRDSSFKVLQATAR